MTGEAFKNAAAVDKTDHQSEKYSRNKLPLTCFIVGSSVVFLAGSTVFGLPRGDRFSSAPSLTDFETCPTGVGRHLHGAPLKKLTAKEPTPINLAMTSKTATVSLR